ncbi:MAG: hypothetical protein A2X22_06665 [Bacteroidetes bacterium GWF2_49_14]|nr:MAG: hypothetical protein A2X22_06665 [Bacteroidetes bacterium GWF2_49_14]HBB92227.1 hypothetical protein [Bacteroidales bacterium]
MASRRNLKKDIDYLITDLIIDCYGCMEEHSEKDFSQYEQIINDAIILKEDLIERINQFSPGTSGGSKSYFLNLKRDLILGVTQAYDKLKSLGC